MAVRAARNGNVTALGDLLTPHQDKSTAIQSQILMEEVDTIQLC